MITSIFAEGSIAKRKRPMIVDAAWINTLVLDVRRCANLFLTNPHTKHAVNPLTRKKKDAVASEMPTFLRKFGMKKRRNDNATPNIRNEEFRKLAVLESLKTERKLLTDRGASLTCVLFCMK